MCIWKPVNSLTSHFVLLSTLCWWLVSLLSGWWRVFLSRSILGLHPIVRFELSCIGYTRVKRSQMEYCLLVIETDLAAAVQVLPLSSPSLFASDSAYWWSRMTLKLHCYFPNQFTAEQYSLEKKNQFSVRKVSLQPTFNHTIMRRDSRLRLNRLKFTLVLDKLTVFWQ